MTASLVGERTESPTTRIALARHAGAVALTLAPLALLDGAAIATPVAVASCAAVACLLASYDDALRAYLERHVPMQRALGWAVGMSVAFMLLRGSMEARWSLVDDHEIADALALGEVDTFTGYWSTLARHREVGSPLWNWPRYRPVYFILRYLECSLWGFNSALWYGARTLMFAASAGLCWRAMVRPFGPSQASLTLLCLLAARFWGDVYCRLGPSEPYAVLGCAMFVFGAAEIVRGLPHARASHGAWAFACAGSVVAFGCKENMVFVPALLAALGAYALRSRRLSRAALCMLAVALLQAAWIAVVLVVSIRRRGTTVYGEDASLLSAPELGAAALQSLWGQVGPFLALLLLALLGCIAYRRSDGWQRRLLEALGGVALCCAIYVLQAIVYKGSTKSNTRYDFPAQLIPMIALSVVAASLRREARKIGLAERLRVGLDAAVLVVATLVVCDGGFKYLRDQVAHNVERTKTFTDSLEGAIDALHREPTRPLLIAVSSAGMHYEYAISLRLFFEYYRVANPVFLQSSDLATSMLAENLRTWSAQGLKDCPPEVCLQGVRGRFGRFLPLGELPQWGNPFVITFGPPAPPNSTPLAIKWSLF